ncbi:histidine kinase [Adlercreutzia sp. ZJ141]|uniref:histidine kinase n=1 Tax=Adlercreutzia sp. ZJ141 TaxID=2709406 RepID=UPI0013EDB4CA|nr:histidine kinase [Adlercreutzia sp. ZJ141]
MTQENGRASSAMSHSFVLEMLMITIAVASSFVLAGTIFGPLHSPLLTVLSGLVFTLSVVVVVRLLMDPDSVRAHQTDSMLKLARQTLENISGEEFSTVQAQKICSLLLPSTAAIAVSITDTEVIRGYVGYDEERNPTGSPIRTQATRNVINDGEMRILTSSSAIGFPSQKTKINAAIIVPLKKSRRQIWGTLKFYYRNPKQITETQTSIAEGFGNLLSTQLAAVSLEEQTKLATQMELKMLQSQINPHFLFNTINTIASLIRTDPNKARQLLREFAVFYRRTLENSVDLIQFDREMEQVERYFSFEVARFGTDRVQLHTDIQPAVNEIMVPSFLVQPLVENAVHHAMPAEGLLTITVKGVMHGEDAIIHVIDDGVGMDEQTCANIMSPEMSTGMGIAVKNVRDRIAGYFGTGATMEVASELGEGTRVTLVLKDAANR